MNRFLIIPLALGLALALAACSSAGKNEGDSAQSGAGADSVSAEDAYHKISAEEAKQMIDAGGVTVVDVRTLGEYTQAHLPNAINLPNESIGTERPEALPNLDDTLIVYCRSGVRSRQASDKLVDMGYTNVYDMGGIVDWPYDTEGEPASG